MTLVYREAWRAVWLDDDPQQSVHALCYMVDRGHRQYAGRLPSPSNCISCARATAVPAPAAITCWPRSRNWKRHGYRDDDLRPLAERLKGTHDEAAS